MLDIDKTEETYTTRKNRWLRIICRSGWRRLHGAVASMRNRRILRLFFRTSRCPLAHTWKRLACDMVAFRPQGGLRQGYAWTRRRSRGKMPAREVEHGNGGSL